MYKMLNVLELDKCKVLACIEQIIFKMFNALEFDKSKLYHTIPTFMALKKKALENIVGNGEKCW